jgi:O-antigen ligase
MTSTSLNTAQQQRQQKGLAILLSTGFIYFSYFYLTIGNIPRFVSLPGFRNNLLITEFLLYLITLFVILLNPSLIAKVISSLGFVISIILLSFFSGALRDGFQLVPFSYAFRLILLLIASFVFGYSLYKIEGSRLVKVLQRFSVIYLCLALVGFTFYVAFPDSVRLWELLDSYGIRFNGDPHQRRLLSSYFDPNFYAAIACIGVFTSLLAYHYSCQLRYILISLVIVMSIMLSSSRSGIATLFAVLLFVAFRVCKHILSKGKFSLRFSVILPLLLLGLIALAPIYTEPVGRAWQRIIQPDESAQIRLRSFQTGQDLFSIAPIFGLGYNYLAVYAQELRDGLSSVDSSPQATLINFGILGTFLLILCIAWFFVRLYVRIRKLPEQIKRPYQLVLWYLNSYVLIIVIFSSQFNNVIYYQFWLFPVIALYSYLWFALSSRDILGADTTITVSLDPST